MPPLKTLKQRTVTWNLQTSDDIWCLFQIFITGITGSIPNSASCPSHGGSSLSVAGLATLWLLRGRSGTVPPISAWYSWQSFQRVPQKSVLETLIFCQVLWVRSVPIRSRHWQVSWKSDQIRPFFYFQIGDTKRWSSYRGFGHWIIGHSRNCLS